MRYGEELIVLVFTLNEPGHKNTDGRTRSAFCFSEPWTVTSVFPRPRHATDQPGLQGRKTQHEPPQKHCSCCCCHLETWKLAVCICIALIFIFISDLYDLHCMHHSGAATIINNQYFKYNNNNKGILYCVTTYHEY